MYIYPNKPPLYRSGKRRLGVFELVLACGHPGGLIDEGLHAYRRKCRECARLVDVVGYRGKEQHDA